MRAVVVTTAVLAALTFPALPANGQDGASESVSFGSATIRLGMPQDVALERLAAAGYTREERLGIVMTKTGRREVLGAIAFGGGVVRTVSREWGPAPVDQAAGVPLAEALFGALTLLTRPTPEGSRMCNDCRIEIGESSGPAGDVKTLFFYQSGTTRVLKLDLITLRQENEVVVAVREQLGPLR